MLKSIAVMTSGGDSPGMNAAVVSVARIAAMHGIQLMGIKRGFSGLLNGEIEELKKTIQDVKNVKICAKCGAEIPTGAKFCLECGEKL